MKAQGGHLLHNITHTLLSLAVSFIFLIMHPSLDPYDVILISLFGGFLPDIDHINIWLEYKFKNFRSFLKFVTKARRFRYSFLIFHNLGTVIVVLLLITIINIISLFGTLFLLAFLAHLLLDFFNDKFSIGRVTHWRYRRRT
jgi:hypothetical protein